MKNLLNKVLSGLSDANIRFVDLRKLLLFLEFKERIKGDHHIFYKTGIMEILNLQPLKDGKAKPYHVKQCRKLIFKYSLNKDL